MCSMVLKVDTQKVDHEGYTHQSNEDEEEDA